MMACSRCRKKRPPLGTAKKETEQTPPPKPSQQTFVLQRRDGTTATFGSRLERDAAQVREGGTPL